MLQTNVRGPLVIAGIVVGLSIALGVGGSFLLARYINENVAAVVAARVEAARISTLGPRLATLKNQQAEAEAYTRIITLLLPTQEQLLEVPRVIEQIGRTHNVDATFSFLGSADPNTGAANASLPFSLTGTGSPTALATFLRDLEIQNPRYTINIASADIAGSAVDTNGARLSANGVVYYQ